MKIKIDFVTNSSSSSFVLIKKFLSEMQIILIKNHIEAGHLFYKEYPHLDFGFADYWCVKELDDTIELTTSMDNFDMKFFLTIINVPDEAIESYDHN